MALNYIHLFFLIFSEIFMVFILSYRLNTNVELCKSLKDLLDNDEIVAKLDPETKYKSDLQFYLNI